MLVHTASVLFPRLICTTCRYPLFKRVLWSRLAAVLNGLQQPFSVWRRQTQSLCATDFIWLQNVFAAIKAKLNWCFGFLAQDNWGYDASFNLHDVFFSLCTLFSSIFSYLFMSLHSAHSLSSLPFELYLSSFVYWCLLSFPLLPPAYPFLFSTKVSSFFMWIHLFLSVYHPPPLPILWSLFLSAYL